jgi:hypothetical protein
MCVKAIIKTGRCFAPSFAFASLLLFLAACTHQPAQQQITFAGVVKVGDSFQHQFAERFIFALEPSEFGWIVTIYEKGRREDLARLTPPFHFVPNPTEIEGWHFRNENNTEPNEGSVNAPQDEREFIFSPEVGRSIDGPTARRQPTPEEIDRVSSFGRGALHIEHLTLSPVKRGDQARILEMKFRCTISWSMPDNSPEPTRVGAFSSAVAVHVTSRRWLGFLR